jgi:hypothetical protein
VCCDRACAGQCEACDDAASIGTCKSIAGAPHGGRSACGDGGGDPCKATRCDGTDAAACHIPPAGVVACGKNSCTKGVETHVAVCDGAGKCVDSSKSCGVYACGATACHSDCAADGDCSDGFYCDVATSICRAKVGLGKACGGASGCDAGLTCLDGYCCGSAACAAGSSCGLAGQFGPMGRSVASTPSAARTTAWTASAVKARALARARRAMSRANSASAYP